MAEVHFKTDAQISISDGAVKYAQRLVDGEINSQEESDQEER